MLNIYCFHGCGQNSELFKSLVNSLHNNNKQHNWFYPQGKHYKREGGWGWYKYNDVDIDQKIRSRDIKDMIKKIDSSTVLLGFSEGGQFVLDIAQQCPNIHGVIAISPSYQKGLGTSIITRPVVLITSRNDAKIMKKYSDKWKTFITDYVEIHHTKGHKVYLPLTTRQIIKSKIVL